MSNDEFEIIPEHREWLEALTDHVILEATDDEENRTPSGLVVPASAARAENGYQRFRVIAVGPMVGEDRLAGEPDDVQVEPGDLVLAPMSELGLYREAGQTYYITRYDMIAAVIREA